MRHKNNKLCAIKFPRPPPGCCVLVQSKFCVDGLDHRSARVVVPAGTARPAVQTSCSPHTDDTHDDWVSSFAKRSRTVTDQAGWRAATVPSPVSFTSQITPHRPDCVCQSRGSQSNTNRQRYIGRISCPHGWAEQQLVLGQWHQQYTQQSLPDAWRQRRSKTFIDFLLVNQSLYRRLVASTRCRFYHLTRTIHEELNHAIFDRSVSIQFHNKKVLSLSVSYCDTKTC